MNIQGSINQLLVLGAAGIKSDKQLQEYRALGKRETQLRKSIDTLTKTAGEETETGLTTDPELDIDKTFKELSSVIGEKYKLNPSKENYKKTYDIENEAVAIKDWYNQAKAGEQWDYKKWREGAPERKAKAEAKSKAEEAAAKAQEDLINRQNERMRKDKSPQINFGSFIEGGIDG